MTLKRTLGKNEHWHQQCPGPLVRSRKCYLSSAIGKLWHADSAQDTSVGELQLFTKRVSVAGH